jgi:L-ribulokinase
VAAAQQAMASQIEHIYQPDPAAVAHFERLYQRYLLWAAQAKTLYVQSTEES